MRERGNRPVGIWLEGFIAGIEGELPRAHIVDGTCCCLANRRDISRREDSRFVREFEFVLILVPIGVIASDDDIEHEVRTLDAVSGSDVWHLDIDVIGVPES